jgi:ATP-dependent Clp protease ATP-binding subunit ClpB
VAHEGFDSSYGARPLKRTLQRRVQNPLALQILEGKFAPGDTVRVDFRDGEFVFEKAGEKKAKAAKK